MAPTILYSGCVLGAVALYLLLRPAPRAVKVIGILLGIGALGWIVKESAAALGAPGEGVAEPFYVLFSLIAVASAVRMITHRRPVYAALYFVLVVLSSAGLFLLLEAEFMAFALVIVYAGAILITYLFVIMLAEQAPQAGDDSRQADYDVIPREPAAAVVVGFVLLALLSDMIFSGTQQLPPAPTPTEVRQEAWIALEALPDRVEAAVRRHVTDFDAETDRLGPVRAAGGQAYVEVSRAGAEPRIVQLPDDAMPENIERVGLSLIKVFPVSLELAGVILLMAMFGAVILARRQIEVTEEQKRQANARAAGGGG
jgi:NADH-quinone oxidoreductase subunit J